MQNVPNVNFRVFGGNLLESLQKKYSFFLGNSIETIRRDCKGNLYVQFKKQLWENVCRVTDYGSSAFNPIPLDLAAWGTWLFQSNTPSLTNDEIQIVINNIPLDGSLEQIETELLKSNQENWKEHTMLGSPVHGIRRLHRKRRGFQGSYEWVASSSIAMWIPESLWSTLQDKTLLLFERQMKLVSVFKPARKFCTRCLEFGTHNAQSCLNKPRCEHCHQEHTSEACPLSREDRLSCPPGVCFTEETEDQRAWCLKKQMVRMVVSQDENMLYFASIATQGELGGLE